MTSIQDVKTHRKTHPRLDSDIIFPVLVVEPEPKQFVQIKECGLTDTKFQRQTGKGITGSHTPEGPDGDQVNTVLYMIRHNTDKKYQKERVRGRDEFW